MTKRFFSKEDIEKARERWAFKHPIQTPRIQDSARGLGAQLQMQNNKLQDKAKKSIHAIETIKGAKW